MKVLFIGGTGNISLSCTCAALDRGIEVFHFNRGSTAVPGKRGMRIRSEVTTITGDIRDKEKAASLLAQHRFDVVVDWFAFTPDHIKTDIELFRGRTDQLLFISSASVYHKPPRSYIITESTPAYNPYWKYAQDKIACEKILMSEYKTNGLPVTIVRPSHTYGDGRIPTTFGSQDFTIPRRILEGREIIIHGDGQSLWTITHSDDFAVGFTGLLGNPNATGETYHITSDEVITWDVIHQTIAAALGAEARIVHMPSDYLAEHAPSYGPGLIGDKQYSLIFDNSKIKRAVPGFAAKIPFFEGMRRSVEWVNEFGEKEIDGDTDKLIDRILTGWLPK
ncbi:MAG: NAD-dependent epimerase/dehydratase family protein [Spirochaetales bacterium]|nr:NAD-dependent epimerase/dehydratase family protein [Spirochaetales bacterium]